MESQEMPTFPNLLSNTTNNNIPNIPNIEIYRYAGPLNPPTLVISSDGKAKTSIDRVAISTYNAALDVVRYYKSEFNRNSFDNKGTTVKIVVGYEESQGSPLNNAFWNSDDKTMYFGDGDGTMFSPLGTAPDIVAHEFAHAVIDSEVTLDYRGQQGGLHESISDIWATGVDGNLHIGELAFTPHVPGDALRELDRPHWKHVKDLPQDDPYVGEPHAMGEPISYAAVLASRSLGLDNIRKIWYTAVVEDLKNHSGFTGLLQAVESAASRLYGSEAKQSISDAFKAVGILR